VAIPNLNAATPLLVLASPGLQPGAMIAETYPAPRQLSTRLIVPLLVVLSALPVIFMLTRAFLASRNAAYWDEIDDVLGLILGLDSGGNWHDTLDRFFVIENEHRTLTSRLLFAGSYWLTGTVNFSVIGVIGNLFLCGLCALLVATAGSTERKVQMGVLLAAFIFQLEHYENFFWSGSSIDHFQIVLLAGGAFAALARGTRPALLGAGLLGLLATFTLAHGLMVWPVGALALAAQRRWRGCGIWLTMAAAAGAVFFCGFEFNSAHHVGDFSVAGIGRLLHYWLVLLGAPLALGEHPVAPFLGAGLLLMLAGQIIGGGLRRERIAVSLALWAVASLFLIAVGRVNFAEGSIASRYYVLGALAWALVLFVKFEEWRTATKPYRILLRALPLLAVFNVVADADFASDARDWLQRRDSAVDSYARNGRDGVGPYALHPNADHATQLLRKVEQAGVYRMPQYTAERWFPDARLVTNLTYNIDQATVDGRQVSIDGWAAFPQRVAKVGQVHVVLESAKSRHIFVARTVPRPDVAAAYPGQRWRGSGFHFDARRWSLPKEDFKIGVLINSERGAQYIMTAQRLDLTAAGGDLDAGVMHPNGNIYDRMILRSPVGTVTAEPNRITRVSLIDLTDTMINVEFAGAGTLTITLEDPSGPAAPKLYNQPNLVYMKGHPSLVITGADETTNISVFSVRSAKASNPKFAAECASYDGVAHIASLSISSANGKFGSVRTANASYSATKGLTGVHAPGVQITGPVFVGDINAVDAAMPVLVFGAASDTRINGGDLFQTNGQPVNVSGITKLKFVEGRTSAGDKLPQKFLRGTLQQNGAVVSAQLAAYPAH